MTTSNILIRCALSLFVLGLSACSGDNDTSTDFPEDDWRADVKILKIGHKASESDPMSVARWEFLTKFLADATGLNVKVYQASDYNGVVQAVASGQVDVASLGAGAYANVNAQVGDLVDPILIRRDSEGVSGYYSGLVVRADSPYHSIEDLQGEPIAYVDFNSTSGYIYPRWRMRRQGIEPDTFFSESAMAGGHLQSVMALLNGQFGAIVVSLSGGSPETGYRWGVA